MVAEPQSLTLLEPGQSTPIKINVKLETILERNRETRVTLSDKHLGIICMADKITPRHRELHVLSKVARILDRLF